MTNLDCTDFDHIQSLSDDELLESLFDYVESEASLFIAPPGEYKKRVALEWLNKKRDAICGELRKSRKLKLLMSKKGANRLELIAACADLISMICGAAPVMLVATIVVRTGFDEFCSCGDSNTKEKK